MKKLMLVAAVFAAIGLHAATVSWGFSDNLATPVKSTVDGWRVWCFLASDSSSSTAATKLLSQADAVALITAGEYAELKTYNTKAGTTKSGGSFASSATSANADWDAGVTITGYAILFDSTDKDLAGVTQYMLTDVQTITFANASQDRTFTVTPTQTWTAVPEPTSGLMLLLGIAGLALKRKQK